jgi:AraC family transcriptional regulator, melibiose operon regulatory protein
MQKPYFEPDHSDRDQPYYPFHCHIQDGYDHPLICAAHWHDAIEILYGTQGSATLMLNGSCYHFKAGDMVLINTRDVHAIWGGPETQYDCIKFSPEILYTAARFIFESRYVLPFTLSGKTPQKVFSSGELNGTFLPELIREIMDEWSKKTYGFELAVRTAISRIFLWVLRCWHDKGLIVESAHPYRDQDLERLRVAFDCLDHAYRQPLTAKHVAERCNMSYSYFSRFFKSVMGKSFTAYLNYVRIKEAEKQLLLTDRTITEIAMDTGFSSASYFISRFRQQKKISPGQYRQQLRSAQSAITGLSPEQPDRLGFLEPDSITG